MRIFKRRSVRSLAAIGIFFCMVCTCFSLNPQSAGAASFDPGSNGTKHVKQAAPALVVSAGDAKKGDGFQGTYKYLTQSQMDSITSEAAADKYFASEQRDTYIKEVTYSAQTKATKGGWDRYKISGLDLRAVAESMGLSTTKDYTVYTKGKDGHSSKLYKAFTEKLYAFPSEDSGNSGGTAVYPAIALKGDKIKSELPRLVFGQSESGDFNMQNWEKWLKILWIGEKTTDLNLSINGKNKAYTLADIIGTKSGSYTSQYQYTDGGKQVTVTATGIPLDQFLSDAAVTGNYTIKTDSGAVITNPSRYFLAYDAKTQDGTEVNSSGSLVLYGPGTTKAQVVKENVKTLSFTIKAPAAAKGMKAVRSSYNQIKLSWKKVTGAQGYNIYRYNSSRKRYELLDCAEGAARVTYTDKGLKTGTAYTYRVKAYVTVSNVDLESPFSNAASAKPTLSKTAVKLSKSGKTAVKVKWSKIAGASGYQVRLGTNKKITKGKKSYTIKSGKTTSKTISKLKRGKRYYVKARAYRTVSGKKVYSSYSSVKSIKR